MARLTRVDTWRDRMAGRLAAGLLASIFFVTPAHARSSPPRYVATVWQTEQGLPQNSVYDMVQDRDGYLWLATWGGLVRFDGTRFRVFGAADVPGLGSSRILSLHASRSGALWIGTRDGGLTRIDNGVATRYAGEGLPRTLVTSIREDAEGEVWINTPGVIARVAGTRLRAYGSHQGKSVSEFYLQARDGSLWFHSGNDIVRFGADGAIATLPVLKQSGFLVREARDGSVWIASNDQPRLVRWYQGAFSDVRLPPVGRRQWAGVYPRAGVLAMATDTDGELLLLTPAGLVRVVNGRPGPAEPLPVPANGGEPPKALSLLVDREGNRWIGTLTTGLHRLRPAPVTAYGQAEGLSDSEFRSVFQDRDRRIWLGGERLYWFDGNQFHLFPGLVDIRAIAQTRNGDLWFGGSGGLYRWRSGVLSRFKIDAPAVSVILEDRQGTLWIVAPTYERPGGLYRFREGRFERVAGDVHNIAEDRGGGLWLASSKGLELLRGDETVLNERNLSSVPDIHQDSTGTLWIAEYGGGLIRFQDGRFVAITTKEGLPNNLPVAILGDGNGYLWVSTDHNILRISLKDLNDLADGRADSISPVSYGIAEGMRASECNSGSPGAWQSEGGQIWFPTLRGVVAIDPTAGNRLPPPVVLEEAWANQLPLGLERSDRSSIPPGNNTLDFRFTALSFSAPDKVRFKYRLEPYEQEWVEAGPRRSAHYTNMDPGEYSFYVTAANDYGVWNEQGNSVRFVLQPHYYQTVGFRALAAAALVALLFSAYRVRMRVVERRSLEISAFNEQLMKAQEQERTRIAGELHDSVMQQITALSLVLGTAKRKMPADSEAREMVVEVQRKLIDVGSEVRQLSHDLYPPMLKEAGLAEVLRGYCDGFGHLRGIPVSCDIVESVAELSPGTALALYRIAQEALGNAAKHAAPTRVDVRLQRIGGDVVLTVADDGRGYEPVKAGGGLGLVNMRERARHLGGTFELDSRPGRGTTVRVAVPFRIREGERAVADRG
jgi:signal transduction histidine kinase/ligand-binding sensor domain-containing protein